MPPDFDPSPFEKSEMCEEINDRLFKYEQRYYDCPEAIWYYMYWFTYGGYYYTRCSESENFIDCMRWMLEYSGNFLDCVVIDNNTNALENIMPSQCEDPAISLEVSDYLLEFEPVDVEYLCYDTGIYQQMFYYFPSSCNDTVESMATCLEEYLDDKPEGDIFTTCACLQHYKNIYGDLDCEVMYESYGPFFNEDGFEDDLPNSTGDNDPAITKDKEKRFGSGKRRRL
jgi:hypothetical protein